MEKHTSASAPAAAIGPGELEFFGKRLIDKIKADKLSPKPRWHFLLKASAIWASGLLALVLGAIATAVMMYLFRFSDWATLSDLQPDGLWKFALLTLPYFWLLFLGLFVCILNYNLRHTARGYRYPAGLVAGASIGASLLMGGLFFAAGWGEKIDDLLGAKAPLYSQLMNRHVVYWNHPAEGRLTGVVIGAEDGDWMTLIDPAGESWQIIASPEQALSEFSHPGTAVKIMGKRTGEGNFQAQMIRTVHAGRTFMNLR